MLAALVAIGLFVVHGHSSHPSGAAKAQYVEAERALRTAGYSAVACSTVTRQFERFACTGSIAPCAEPQSFTITPAGDGWHVVATTESLAAYTRALRASC